MTRSDLLTFLRAHRYAVQASVSPLARPQAAVVGIAVSHAFELVFDTVGTSRKGINLSANPAIAFVIGGTADGDERTVQYEGVADVPSGEALEAARALYFARFPDGRDRLSWPGLIHVRVTPTWIRYSDFNANPPQIRELDAAALAALV
jgi:hypothetical protein